MAVPLEKFVKQLEDSGILAGDTLKEFLPPKASPRDAEELARELVRLKKLTKFQIEEIYRGKGKSLVLGNYVLLEKIGQGGMGEVFKARHRRMDRLVAVKLLPANVTKDNAAIARFDREVKAAAKLRHTNIVAADDADEANGVHFLVMEYVDGKDLSATVKSDGPLPVNRAVNYTLQAARGLEFAHSQGVVHRDIKPANLLLDKTGVVKILDMGLARIEQADGGAQTELTSTGTIMGTIDYMAPEQAINTKNADHRADIYSLGISLYYLLAGKGAYGGDTAMEKLMAHQNQPIPSLQDVQTTVPKELDAVFKKMVAKKVADRYQSMREVIEALEGLGFGGSITDAATALFLSSADRKKLASKAKKKPLGTITEVVVSEKSRHLVAKIVGGAFATIIAPILVTFLIKHLEKGDSPQKPPDAAVSAATVLPVAVGSSATSPPAVPVTAVVDPAEAKTPPPAATVGPAPPLAKAPFDAAQARKHQEAWAKYRGVPVEYTNSIGMKFIYIPPGKFTMGSSQEEIDAALKLIRASWGEGYIKEERLQHEVEITQGFYMGETEVTFGQFRQFVDEAKYNVGDDRWTKLGWEQTENHPVVWENWNDAVAFCLWLSKKEGEKYGLPTEAQWEYGCRAGTKTGFSFGDNEGEIQRYAWIGANSQGKLQPVKELLPNPWGLRDMHGNVLEWCQDVYDPNDDKTSPPKDPPGPAGGARVRRGGSWRLAPVHCRSAFPQHAPPGHRSHEDGFRAVLVPSPPAGDAGRF